MTFPPTLGKSASEEPRINGVVYDICKPQSRVLKTTEKAIKNKALYIDKNISLKLQHECKQGFESLRLWTWNSHLEVDPLGVTDVELKCVNSTSVTHALNQHEPHDGEV